MDIGKHASSFNKQRYQNLVFQSSDGPNTIYRKDPENSIFLMQKNQLDFYKN